MSEFVAIQTERLLIEQFSDEFLNERYVGWLNDREVTRYSEQRHTVHTLEECREYMLSFKGSPNMFLAISARDIELGHIGNINVYIDEANRLADLGIMVGEKIAWGNGYAAEAWKSVCRYLFTERNVRKITAGTMSENKAMVRLMKRCGMKVDGIRTRQYVLDGNEVDLVYGALFSNENQMFD